MASLEEFPAAKSVECWAESLVVRRPRAPPPPPKPVSTKPVVVGGNVMASKRIDHVQPVYPALARQAHISGQVVIHAIISKDGRQRDLSVVSSTHPLLIQAAMDAVRQFRYSPTMLNNEPVDVDTTITNYL